MGTKFAGKNLAITVGGTALNCPQSFDVDSDLEFIEFYCVGTAGKQRIPDGVSWSASATFFPDNDDASDIAGLLNDDTAVAVVVYPDGNTASNIKITFNAFSAPGLSVNRGSVASGKVKFVVSGDVTFAAATGS